MVFLRTSPAWKITLEPRAGGEEMPTNLWLALISTSLHRIADHCKRYEVTSAEGGPGGCKFAHPTVTLRSSGTVTWTMRKCRTCQHKLLNMLWLRSISHQEMGFSPRRQSGWPLLWARPAFYEEVQDFALYVQDLQHPSRAKSGGCKSLHSQDCCLRSWMDVRLSGARTARRGYRVSSFLATESAAES